jgi:hypothetical protein
LGKITPACQEKIAARGAELRGFAAKNFQTVETTVKNLGQQNTALLTRACARGVVQASIKAAQSLDLG